MNKGDIVFFLIFLFSSLLIFTSIIVNFVISAVKQCAKEKEFEYSVEANKRLALMKDEIDRKMESISDPSIPESGWGGGTAESKKSTKKVKICSCGGQVTGYLVKDLSEEEIQKIKAMIEYQLDNQISKAQMRIATERDQ